MARWHSCNILQTAPDATRLWQFDARKGGTPSREHGGTPGEPLPSGLVAKSWTSLWQPRLNVAWLPPENIFLRVFELPRSSFGETLSMVELQLEKLSPMPVAQIVWTIHILPPAQAPAHPGETAGGELQTVIVVIVERRWVEDFLGKLEGRGYLADRLEAPMLDQLEATPATEDGAWIYPLMVNSQSAALVAWRFGGTLRNLSFVVLPIEGDRAKSLKDQLAQLAWAGELEGWLNAAPTWHLVAEGAPASDWETMLQAALEEPVRVVPPLPLPELAARTARRAMAASPDNAVLLPAEFATRYHQQWVDRLWLRGLIATGVLYAAAVVVYFCATYALGYHTRDVEQQVAAISGNYTNALQLKARSEVLKERQDLKYAALDCWKFVSEQFPEGITLQRLSFSDGQKLTLAGTATPDQITSLIDLNKNLHANGPDNKPMFLPDTGDALKYQQNNNSVTWNISLLLAHAEDVKE
jgi:hypothetical protein